jgi:RNA polymerase sigma-70 factor (ECF subfamily)
MDPRADARTDDALLTAVAEGDRGALRALHARHAPWIHLRLRHRCGDEGLIEEVVQDAFVRVWRKASTYRGAGDVAAWIWTIAIHRLIDRLRKQTPLPVDYAPAAMSASLEEQILVDVEHGDLASAINRLSPELRMVVQATLIDGLTTREAARLLNIPVGTVKTRIMRAKPLLREQLA